MKRLFSIHPSCSALQTSDPQVDAEGLAIQSPAKADAVANAEAW